MARPTVALFDVDGTLVSCGGAGRRAMEAAFRELAARDDVFDFSFGGSTDRAIARRAFTAAGLDPDPAALEAFLERYLHHLPSLLARSESYRVLPGARELLDALAPLSHIAVGLGTGNVEAGARLKLRRGDLETRFSFGGFGCDHEERARLLEAGAQRGAARLGVAREDCRIVVIGDTIHDVTAARAIGAECLAVATGTSSIDELTGDVVLADLSAPEAVLFLRD